MEIILTLASKYILISAIFIFLSCLFVTPILMSPFPATWPASPSHAHLSLHFFVTFSVPPPIVPAEPRQLNCHSASFLLTRIPRSFVFTLLSFSSAFLSSSLSFLSVLFSSSLSLLPPPPSSHHPVHHIDNQHIPWRSIHYTPR